MNHTINNLLHTFSNAQRFLVTLLCEYYEDKRMKESQEVTELFDENKSLRDEIKKLETEMRYLREDNRNLSSKLRSANNMIRILTKTRESTDECKTPTKDLNILGVESLLKEKINNKALVSSQLNLDFKKVQFDFSKQTSNLKVKPTEVTKLNNKSILKSRNEEPNNLKNILKKIENKKSATSGFFQGKPRLLTNRRNVTSKNGPKEQKNTESSKFDAVQKFRENRKREIPKGALTTRVQPNREVKRAHLESFNSRSHKQDKKINDETYVIQ